MKITLSSETSLLVEGTNDDLTIEAESYAQKYSPFHMLASSLGNCTFAVLSSWAEQAKLDTSDLAVEIAWKVNDAEHRLEELTVAFRWPSLPAERQRAAIRAAELCSIHKTLTHPPAIKVEQKS
jgi:putative redox protein